MLQLDHVAVRSGAFQLVDVSLALGSGELGVLMGKTGSGKTTLLEAICGLRKVTAGAIRLHDVDVTALHPADREIGYVPQDLALFPTLTVREHFEFALDVRGVSASARKNRVAELADLLGIGALLDRKPEGLSGGEAQRVALGRAISFKPRVLLLDEPLSALDEETRHEMYTLLRNVQRQTGVTTLHITHSRAEAAALADRLFVLRDGKICAMAASGSTPL